MAQCFVQKNMAKVDLYYNDLFGLEKSILAIDNFFEELED